ncbi:hypothetical protein BJV78DRAFT_786922 [Lactifluus subvellereus]|nr:hypothetical protein BJV78DRAFT_786922 [Lactifluus subvellereus]
MSDRDSFMAPSTSNDIGVYNRQRYWQGTMLPQSSPAHKELSTLAGVTLPPSHSTPVGVLGHAPTGSPVHRETVSMGNPSVTGLCPVPSCQKTCSRQQELERHVREHLPHFLCCPHQSCAWRGNRHYILQDHLRKKHAGIPTPEPGEDTIYDPKGLVKQLINGEIDMEQANRAASLMVRRRAVGLGKRGIWGCEGN